MTELVFVCSGNFQCWSLFVCFILTISSLIFLSGRPAITHSFLNIFYVELSFAIKSYFSKEFMSSFLMVSAKEVFKIMGENGYYILLYGWR